MTSQPNPGSPEAVKLGCTCPVHDNGMGAGVGAVYFWQDITCQVHGSVSKPAPTQTTEDAAIAALKDELRRGVFLERHFWSGMANFYAGASK